MITKIIPEEELDKNFLGVQKVRVVGNGNICMNVNKWFRPGENVSVLKKECSIWIVKGKKADGISRTVRKTGQSHYVSLMNICDSEGYYSIHQSASGIKMQPATTEETLRFARRFKRTGIGECLVKKQPGIQVHIKKEDLKIFPKDAHLSVEFHHTEDNLMWFEVFADDKYSANAVRCNFTIENSFNVPKAIFELTGLEKHDVLHCFQHNKRLIIELPYISCETCGETINRRVQPTKKLTVGENTKNTCRTVKMHLQECDTPKMSQIAEVLQMVQEINKLLGGN